MDDSFSLDSLDVRIKQYVDIDSKVGDGGAQIMTTTVCIVSAIRVSSRPCAEGASIAIASILSALASTRGGDC